MQCPHESLQLSYYPSRTEYVALCTECGRAVGQPFPKWARLHPTLVRRWLTEVGMDQKMASWLTSPELPDGQEVSTEGDEDV
jgi:hypothetical protein